VTKTEGRRSERRICGEERGKREKEEEKEEENEDKESSRRVGDLE